MLSLLIQHKHIYFVDLAQLEDLLPLKQLKPKKGTITTNIPLIISSIEVFSCLDKQVNVFLHNHANAMWNFKGLECPYLSVLVIFFHQKFSITLKRMQTSSILNRVVAVGLVISWLPPFQGAPRIITINILQVVGYWNREILTSSLC